MIYAIGSLISMGVMSLTAALAGLSVFASSPILEAKNFYKWVTESYRNNFEFRLFSIATMAVVFSCVISLAAAAAYPVTWQSGVNYPHFKDIFKVWYLFWPFILVYGISKISSESRAKILNTWIIAFVALSVIGVIQYFTGWPRQVLIPFRAPEDSPRYHAVLFLGQHLSVASILIFPYFFALEALVNKNLSSRLKLPKALLAVGVFFGTVTLYFTFSRTLWVALPVGVFVWMILQLKRKKKILLVMAASVLALLMYQVPLVRERLTMPHGIPERQILWRANFEFFLKRPLTGVGFGQTISNSAFYIQDTHPTYERPLVSHAHNVFLEVLASTGIIGFASWLFYVGLLIYFSWRRGWKGLSAAWIVFLLNGLTQVNFWESKVLHQIMWVAAWSILGL